MFFRQGGNQHYRYQNQQDDYIFLFHSISN